MRQSQKTGYAVFVKTIGLSTPKTRLAAGIGRDKADEFYRLSCDLIQSKLSLAQSQDLLVPYWAVAESLEQAQTSWSEFEVMSQGEGQLGDRLHKIYSELLAKHGRTALIGADAPQIPHTVFQEVTKLLDQGMDFVFGPARDGGFYLLAGQKPIPHEVFSQVSYSAESTLDELETLLKNQGAKTKRLEVLSDADHLDDLPNLSEEMKAQDSRDAKHQQMLSWLDHALQGTNIS